MVKEIEEDPSIGQMTRVIYMKGEDEWIGVDQNTDDVDFKLYDEIKTFLQGYFCDPASDEEDSKWCSSIQNALTKGSMYVTGGSYYKNNA